MIDREGATWVAGHRGLVGRALVRRLEADGFTDLPLRDRDQLDLRREDEVERFFEAVRPAYVFLAAARVGGILANVTRPGEFIHDNLRIQVNLIEAARRYGVKKLLFLGSSCIYPKYAEQPIREDALLTGPLEPTNRAYAVAKIAGLEMCRAYRAQYGCRFISLMPTNLYGPGDTFDEASGHVVPSLMRRFHEARRGRSESVAVWGSGRPRREFLHVDDLADAALHAMDHYDGEEVLNVGSGNEVTIAELARRIAAVVGFDGRIEFDPSKPDGPPRKLLDVARMTALGWTASMPLDEGLRQTYDWYRNQVASGGSGASIRPSA